MPEIKQYTRQTQPTGFIRKQDTRGVTNDGSALAGLGNVVEQYAIKTAKSDYVAKMSQFQIDSMRRLEELKKEDFGDADLSQVFQQDLEARAAEMKFSPLMSEQLQADLAQMSVSAAKAGLQEQAERAGLRASENWKIAYTNGMNMISMDPSTAPNIQAQLEEQIILNTENDPAQREVALQSLAQDIAIKTLYSRAEKDPVAFVRDAKAGVFSGPKEGMESYYERLVNIESNNNPFAENPKSSAKGLYQFIDSTGKQYGLDKYKFGTPEYTAAEERAVREFTEKNRKGLKSFLGREPTQGELYMAHQQGLGGAKKILSNPNENAVKALGKKAVLDNGGNTNMTLGDFASEWTSKFDGNPVIDNDSLNQLVEYAENKITNANQRRIDEGVLDLMTAENSLFAQAANRELSLSEIQDEFNRLNVDKSVQGGILKIMGYGNLKDAKLSKVDQLNIKREINRDIANLQTVDKVNPNDIKKITEKIYMALDNGSYTVEQASAKISNVFTPAIESMKNSLSEYSYDTWRPLDQAGFDSITKKFKKFEIDPEKSTYSEAEVAEMNAENEVRLYELYESALISEMGKDKTLADFSSLTKDEKRIKTTNAETKALEAYVANTTDYIPTGKETPTEFENIIRNNVQRQVRLRAQQTIDEAYNKPIEKPIRTVDFSELPE